VKLLIISAAYPPIKSGGSDLVMRMAAHLAAAKMDVTVLTGTRAVAQHDTYKVLPIIENWSWLDIFACRRILQEVAPDIVDIHFTGWVYNDHPMITFLSTMIKQLLPQTHVCVHIESLGGIRRELSTIFDVVVRRFATQFTGREQINYEYGSLLRDSDSIIFLSGRDKYELSKMFDHLAEKSFVIPPPPIMPVVPPPPRSTITQTRQELGVEEREIVLAYYGYVYPGKGIETLLSAVHAMAQEKRDVALVIVGGAPEQRVLNERCKKPNYLEELKSSAVALGIEDRVRWMGYSPPESERPSRLLRACDICVLPFDSGVMLHNSSFAFAAMHHMPIVTTRSQDTEPVFADKENVILVLPAHPLDLCGAVVELFDDKLLQEKISAGALAMAERQLSWDGMLQDTLNAWR
jgi:glycosyltransferase involved in cell wall biosynthesis